MLLKKVEISNGISIFASGLCTHGFQNFKCWDDRSNGILIRALYACMAAGLYYITFWCEWFT
ncbi:hypothetical protein T4D_16427 [Trichinella pseudospiralis]|uniref:Transmembrane protein n=1 Tax=Trichinella pseudospiralis TaxID=6337 RepID=A0A0V1FZ50_TRIPS|nr:hypothetical protein T4D_9067 [Trichinella pseudospiralis]KRY91262.1 hypothetical protein T4D_16427 [Trichinella pseudospiralis]